MISVLVVKLRPRGGPVDLGEQRAEVGRLGHVEPAGAVLGGQAVGVAGAADEAAHLALGRLVAPAVAAGANRLMLITWSTIPAARGRPCRPPSAAASARG